MKNLPITMIFLLLLGCSSHQGSFNLFPRNQDLDLNAIDLAQKKGEHDSRFFMNCNWVDDYMIKDQLKSVNVTFDWMDEVLTSSGFEIIPEKDAYSLKAYRGQKANEWETFVMIYVQPEEDINRIYIRTEITQDATCGWNENRAKAIAEWYCDKASGCVDMKEITKKTKKRMGLK